MSKTFNRGLMACESIPGGSQTPGLNAGSPTILIDAESGVDGLQNALFVDSSPAARAMTVFGDVHQGKFSPFAKNWSACFNGVNQYMRASTLTTDIELPQVFTIELWFCLTSNLTYKNSSNSYMGRLLSGSGTGMLELTVSGATPVPTGIGFGRFGAGSLLSVGGLNIPIGVWHHVAVSRNASGNLSMFFNGVRVGAATGSTAPLSPGEAFVGGVNVTGWHGYFPGYVSNLRVVKGNAVHSPTLSTCQVPTDTLTAVAGTSILCFTKSNFANQIRPSAAVVHYNSPRMLPFAPFRNDDAVGGSAYFDGAGDYLKTSSHLDLSPENQNFCIESFVYFMPGAASVCFFSKIEGPYPAAFEWVMNLFNGNAFNFSVILTGGFTLDLSTTGDIIGGQWYHVAATRKGSVISLFVNGIRRVTKTINSAIWVTGSGVTVGKDLENATNRPLTGFLSNSRMVKGDYVYDPELTTLTVPEQPLTAIPGTGLLLKYENSGIHDLTGMSLVKTVGNARGRTDIKKDGTGSLFFDGVGDYLEIPHQDALNLSRGDFTIQGWVRFNSFPAAGQAHTLFDKDSLNGTRYASYAFLVDSTGRLLAWTGNGAGLSPTGTTYQSTKVLTINEFHHFVFQRKANTISIYVDGVLELTSPVGVAPVNGAGPLTVGGNADRADRFMHGFIDKLEIIQGRALYTANFIPE